MSYMNDGCDPFGIPYIGFENKKTIKKERDKPIERFTYNGCIIFDRDNRIEVWETVNFLNELVKENEQLKSDYDTLKIQDDARKQYQKELMKENEELKKEVKQLKNKINTYHEGNKTLHQTLQKYWEDRYNE